MNEARGAKVVLACDRSQAARFEGVDTNLKDDWNMPFKDKTLDEMYEQLAKVEREREAKGRSHPEYEMAGIMIESIKRAIEEKQRR